MQQQQHETNGYYPEERALTAEEKDAIDQREYLLLDQEEHRRRERSMALFSLLMLLVPLFYTSITPAIRPKSPATLDFQHGWIYTSDTRFSILWYLELLLALLCSAFLVWHLVRFFRYRALVKSQRWGAKIAVIMLAFLYAILLVGSAVLSLSRQ